MHEVSVQSIRYALLILLAAFLFLLAPPAALPTFAQAENDANSAISDENKDERVYRVLKQADVLIGKEQFVEARKLLSDLTQFDPSSNSGNLHSMLGYVDKHLGNMEGAIAENEKAMEFDPRMVDLAWNVALAYKDLGNYEKAREWIGKYLQSGTADKQRRSDAEGLMQKLGEQEKLNGFENPNAPEYLDALVHQRAAGRWPRSNFPLKIHVEKSDHVLGVPEDADDLLAKSFAVWNQAANGALPFEFTDSRRKADIVIKWTDKPGEVKAHDGVHLEQGVTKVDQYLYPGSPISSIRHADMTLLTVSRQTGEPLESDKMHEVCLHEIGHALGLVGHSANSADVMYFATSARQLPALSKRDKTTISILYGRSQTGNQPISSMPSVRQPAFYPGQNGYFPRPQPYPGFSGQAPGRIQAFQPSYAGSQQAPQYPIPNTQAQPYQPYPSQSYPNQQYQNQPYPSQSYPSQAYPNQPYPSQPYPNQPYPSQPYPNQPYPNQPYPNQPYPGQPCPAR